MEEDWGIPPDVYEHLSSTSQATPRLRTGESYVFRFPTTRVMVVEDGEDIETIDFDLPKQAEGCPLPENVETISRKTAEDLMRVVEGAKNAIVQYVIRSRNKIKHMESCIQEKDVEIAQLRSDFVRLQQNVKAQSSMTDNRRGHNQQQEGAYGSSIPHHP